MDYRLSLLSSEKLDKITINTLVKDDIKKAIEDSLENVNNVEKPIVGFVA